MATIFYTGASNLAFSDDDQVTTVYTTQKFPLLTKREENGIIFRFVKYVKGSNNVVCAANNLVYYTATTGQVTGSHADSLVPAGWAQGVIADTGFGWIAVRGPQTMLTNSSNDIVIGDALVVASATDSAITRVNAGQYTTTAGTLAQVQNVLRVTGYALATENNGTHTVAGFATLE
jgi:hypothetical protein